jgi:hypothetical protein
MCRRLLSSFLAQSAKKFRLTPLIPFSHKCSLSVGRHHTNDGSSIVAVDADNKSANNGIMVVAQINKIAGANVLSFEGCFN